MPGPLSVFASPARYSQGPNATFELGREMERCGLEGPVLILAGASARKLLSPIWREHLSIPFQIEGFRGESTAVEIARVRATAEQMRARTIVGAGGGKLIDTARAAASEAGLGLAICPTVASSDAPTSAGAVVFQPDLTFEEYRFYNRNPDLVLVDTAVIARAPTRFLVAGMGDALSTYFEARACREAGAVNQKNGVAAEAGLGLAKLCFETLLADGVAAKQDAERQRLTPALERIVEANTLLSGIGFESGGLAAAHSVHNGLTLAAETHHFLHGEKVAFGALAQLALEGRPESEIRQARDFAVSAGLPVTLSQLGLSEIDDATLRRIAERAVIEGETIHHEPFAVNASMVVQAIESADAAGRTALQP